MDQHAVSPVRKSGLRARTIYWERRVRISSWPGCNRSPLARGRNIYATGTVICDVAYPCTDEADHTFFPKVFQSGNCRALRVCQEPFPLRVLVFQRLQPLAFGYVHAAEFGTPFIDAGIADTVLAAKLRDRRAASCSLRMPMISSSVKRFASFPGSLNGPDIGWDSRYVLNRNNWRMIIQSFSRFCYF